MSMDHLNVPFDGSFGHLYGSAPNSNNAADITISGHVAKQLLDNVEQLRELVSILSKSNEALVAEVAELRKEVQALRAPVKYSDAVKRNLAPKQLHEVALVRRALREEKGADERARNLILKEERAKEECEEVFKKITKKINVNPKCNRLGKEGKSRLIRVSFPSVEEAKRRSSDF